MRRKWKDAQSKRIWTARDEGMCERAAIEREVLTANVLSRACSVNRRCHVSCPWWTTLYLSRLNGLSHEAKVGPAVKIQLLAVQLSLNQAIVRLLTTRVEFCCRKRGGRCEEVGGKAGCGPCPMAEQKLVAGQLTSPDFGDRPQLVCAERGWLKVSLWPS